MRTISIYKVGEAFPDNGKKIGYIYETMFGVKMYHGQVEYTYLERNDNGEFTGNQIVYDPSNTPEDMNKVKLVAMVDGFELADHNEYFYTNDLFGE